MPKPDFSDVPIDELRRSTLEHAVKLDIVVDRLWDRTEKVFLGLTAVICAGGLMFALSFASARGLPQWSIWSTVTAALTVLGCGALLLWYEEAAGEVKCFSAECQARTAEFERRRALAPKADGSPDCGR